MGTERDTRTEGGKAIAPVRRLLVRLRPLVAPGVEANTALVLFPSSHWARFAGLVLAGSFLVALCAQVSVSIGPVPITGQTFGVLAVSLLYGSRLAVATLAAYLAQGALGLPVFAEGKAGVAALVGPSGGYLWGFVLAAFVVGWLADRGWDRSLAGIAMAMLIGNVVLYVPGLLWLRGFAPDWATALQWGVTPFLPGDALKLVLACCVVLSVRRAAERWRSRREG